MRTQHLKVALVAATFFIGVAGGMPTVGQEQPQQLPPQAHEVMGKTVVGAAGQELGRVSDVVLDQQGNIDAVILDRGAAATIGSKRVAIDWDQLSVSPDRQALTVPFTENQVAELPEIEEPASVTEPGQAQPLPSQPQSD